DATEISADITPKGKSGTVPHQQTTNNRGSSNTWFDFSRFEIALERNSNKCAEYDTEIQHTGGISEHGLLKRLCITLTIRPACNIDTKQLEKFRSPKHKS